MYPNPIKSWLFSRDCLEADTETDTRGESSQAVGVEVERDEAGRKEDGEVGQPVALEVE